MVKRWIALAALVTAVGCGGNPLDDDGQLEPPDPTDEIGVQLAGSVRGLDYDPAGDGSLRVIAGPLDSSPTEAIYTRAPGLDRRGYQAFTYTEPGSNRRFVAFMGARGDLFAGVVGDGGRNVDAFGGGGVGRGGEYQQPVSGLATYRGGYAGVRVREDGAVNARRPDLITGTAQINADFTELTVEGSISNRINTSVPADDPAREMDDRFLKVTDITEGGQFQGLVSDPGDNISGSYAGAFGGSGASSVAGTVAIDDNNKEGYQDDVSEFGVFVLDCIREGNPAAPPECR